MHKFEHNNLDSAYGAEEELKAFLCSSVTPQGYLPTSLYNLDSAYGTEEELKALIAKLHAHNMLAICDVVINHRCADQQDAEGNWTQYG